jgi:hypothetical protein
MDLQVTKFGTLLYLDLKIVVIVTGHTMISADDSPLELISRRDVICESFYPMFA